MDSERDVIIEQSLCLSCGICCDGTIFGKVPLQPEDELPPLQSAGIAIETKGDKKFFKLGCAAHRQNCCQVYHHRPANCRKYRCALLKKYESGDVSREDAQQKVERARELKKIFLAEFEKTLPGHGWMSLPAILKIVPENRELKNDPALLKKWGATLLCLSALLDYVQTHFQPPRRKEDSRSA